MKIAYLLDSGSSFNIFDEKDCYFVPMGITVTDGNIEKNHFDDNNFNGDKLKEILAPKSIVKTSQPIIGQIICLIEDLLKSYDKIIIIPFSRHLSSTFNSVLSVQKQFGNDKVLVADINAMSIIGNWFVNDLKDYISKNNDINQEILDFLSKNFREHQCGALIVNDSSRLISGGRLKGIKGLIVKTLKLKLIIKYDGKLEFANKAIHIQDAIDKALDIINETCKFYKNGIKRYAIFADLNDEKENKKYIEYVQSKLKTDYFYIAKLPNCVQCHTGLNSFSILIESNSK